MQVHRLKFLFMPRRLTHPCPRCYVLPLRTIVHRGALPGDEMNEWYLGRPVRQSYNGYYPSLPSWRRGFDSHLALKKGRLATAGFPFFLIFARWESNRRTVPSPSPRTGERQKSEAQGRQRAFSAPSKQFIGLERAKRVCAERF